MKEENINAEGILILLTVILLLILSLFVFEKILPTSFQKITGNVVTRVNVTQPQVAYCNFTLYSGLNLVSFFCIPTMHPRDQVIGNLSSLEAIFEYQEEKSDAWKSYNPSLPNFVIQDLSFMSRTEGYWIMMRNNQQFLLEGALRRSTSILLVPGWNLVGYPTNTTMVVNNSFISILSNMTEARTRNPLSGNFISYVPGIGGALNQTEPYYGYWINATVDEGWIFE